MYTYLAYTDWKLLFTWAVWLHSCSDVLLVSHLTTDARNYAISVELPVKLYGNGEYSE